MKPHARAAFGAAVESKCPQRKGEKVTTATTAAAAAPVAPTAVEVIQCVQGQQGCQACQVKVGYVDDHAVVHQ